MLHGVDIQPPSSRFAKSMGHQHVLEPELRTREGAGEFARHLLTKAAERLRRGDYFCRRLGLHLSWTGDLGGRWDEISFNETRDTGFLLVCLDQLWDRAPRYKPLSVGVVLLDLVPASSAGPTGSGGSSISRGSRRSGPRPAKLSAGRGATSSSSSSTSVNRRPGRGARGTQTWLRRIDLVRVVAGVRKIGQETRDTRRKPFQVVRGIKMDLRLRPVSMQTNRRCGRSQRPA